MIGMTTDWNILCKERSNHIREKMDAEDRRINYLEKNNTKLSELAVQMGEILKFHQEMLHAQEEKLERLESNPKMLTNSFKTAVISASVSGLISYVIAQLL